MLFASGVGSLNGEGWQVKIYEFFKKFSNWWPRFYTWSQNVQFQTIQEFVVGNRKDLLNGWQIHEWGALANSFNFTFTKWLMR
jgi:hypothetical protein